MTKSIPRIKQWVEEVGVGLFIQQSHSISTIPLNHKHIIKLHKEIIISSNKYTNWTITQSITGKTKYNRRTKLMLNNPLMPHKTGISLCLDYCFTLSTKIKKKSEVNVTHLGTLTNAWWSLEIVFIKFTNQFTILKD